MTIPYELIQKQAEVSRDWVEHSKRNHDATMRAWELDQLYQSARTCLLGALRLDALTPAEERTRIESRNNALKALLGLFELLLEGCLHVGAIAYHHDIGPARLEQSILAVKAMLAGMTVWEPGDAPRAEEALEQGTVTNLDEFCTALQDPDS